MRQTMTPEIAIAAKDLATRGTVVRLDVGVCEQMRLQIGALIERSIADGTLVRRLLHVQDLVHGQRARLAESFATFGALEGFLLGVNVSVIR